MAFRSFFFIWFIVIPQIIFRFNHPKMTETELFLNFFQAYKEIFNCCQHNGEF